MSAIGIDTTFTVTSAERQFGLLNLAFGSHKAWLYVQAGAAFAAGDNVVVDELGAATELTTTNSKKGNRVGVCPCAFASGDYGFVQVYGVTSSMVLTLAAPNVNINTTATGGALDDDATAGSKVINGIVLTTARGAGTGTAPAVLNWPTVGVTST